MKSTIVSLILLFTCLSSFAQNKTASEFVAVNYSDTLVDFYERQGIRFYHNQKYDTAIKKFIKAEQLVDSLATKRKKLGDYINSLVTKCNIALCYCKLHQCSLGLEQLPLDMNILIGQWMNLKENKMISDQNKHEMVSFLDFTEADCYKEIKGKKSELEWYVDAYINLSLYLGDSVVMRNKYALKIYRFQNSYKNTLDSFSKAEEDSTNINPNLYLNKLIRISEDK